MLVRKSLLRFSAAGCLLLLIVGLAACKTTESTVKQDYSNGINIAVAASGANPAYHITETVGAAGAGFAYMLEKDSGRWRMMYDSFDAKAFAKPVGHTREVPANSEVLWTDGVNVAVYFGSDAVDYSRVDGSFECPKNKDEPRSRACRSQFTTAKSLFDGLGSESKTRPYVLDFEEIKRAVAETGIVASAKKRLAK
jgi:hypothetical protein